MRRAAILLSALVLGATTLLAASPIPDAVPLTQRDIGTGANIISDNLVYLGTLANEAPSIGAEVVRYAEDDVRLVTTGAKGLSIYDITIPVAPVLLGHLPLPHFQNESVSVSKDGKIALIATDTAAAGTGGFGNGVRIIDISNPMLPTQLGRTTSSTHTAMCAVADCSWIYTSSGRTVDATNPASPKDVGYWHPSRSGGHALFLDDSGLIVSDSSTRLILDPSDNPAFPTVLAQGTVPNKFKPDGLLQHNGYRDNADEWVPRDPENPADALVNDENGRAADLRPGELLIGTSESNLNISCGNAGGLSTWDMRDFDKGRPMEMMEVVRPIKGTYANGDPAVNALGCSAHWFDVKEGMIAAGWYEHGFRFFDVDLSNGKLTQTAFFQPLATQAGSAHFVGTYDVPGLGEAEIVYTTDYAHGIDVLAFFPDAATPSQEEFDASWMANVGKRLFIPHRDLHGSNGDYSESHLVEHDLHAR